MKGLTLLYGHAHIGSHTEYIITTILAVNHTSLHAQYQEQVSWALDGCMWTTSSNLWTTNSKKTEACDESP